MRQVTRYYDRMAQVVFLLTRAPRTVMELIHLLGMNGNRSSAYTQVMRYLLALEAEGLVARAGKRHMNATNLGRKSTIWVWVANAGNETNA